MTQQQSLGRHIDSVDVELFRDSPFVDYIQRESITTAFLLFPTLDPPVQWDATVDTDPDDETLTRASWSVSKTQTNAMPDRTPVEVWVDGEACMAGQVVRSGDLG